MEERVEERVGETLTSEEGSSYDLSLHGTTRLADVDTEEEKERVEERVGERLT